MILKSPREEYIFTDRALISVCGSSSIGTKKITERYDWSHYHVSAVRLKSPGIAGTDFDGELSFNLGSVRLSIDLRRDEWENIKPLYRTLIRLQERHFRDATGLRLFQEVLSKPWIQTADPNSIKDLAFAASAEALDRFFKVSYLEIWEQHGKDV